MVEKFFLFCKAKIFCVVRMVIVLNYSFTNTTWWCVIFLWLVLFWRRQILPHTRPFQSYQKVWNLLPFGILWISYFLIFIEFLIEILKFFKTSILVSLISSLSFRSLSSVESFRFVIPLLTENDGRCSFKKLFCI